MLCIWLENAYACPFLRFFCVFNPVTGKAYQLNPKRHILACKYVICKCKNEKSSIEITHICRVMPVTGKGTGNCGSPCRMLV